MEKLKKFHKYRFGPDTHNIPDSLELCLSKMLHGGSMSTDTCNSARKFLFLSVEEVTKICEDKSQEKFEDPANLLIMRNYYHNHLQNVWIGDITMRLSKYLD